MSDWLNLLLDVLIAVLAFLAVQGFYVLVNFFAFEQPFTKELLEKKLATQKAQSAVRKNAILRGAVLLCVCSVACTMLCPVTKPSGPVAYALTTGLVLLFMRPPKEMRSRSPYNIKIYLRKYAPALDVEGYKKEYAAMLED